MSEQRFYIDHGMIHDRVTGKHVTTDGQPPFEDSLEQVLELLNSLAPPRGNYEDRQTGGEPGIELREALEKLDEIINLDSHGRYGRLAREARDALTKATEGAVR